jgi:hypothetical protein
VKKTGLLEKWPIAYDGYRGLYTISIPVLRLEILVREGERGVPLNTALLWRYPRPLFLQKKSLEQMRSILTE